MRGVPAGTQGMTRKLGWIGMQAGDKVQGSLAGAWEGNPEHRGGQDWPHYSLHWGWGSCFEGTKPLGDPLREVNILIFHFSMETNLSF